MSTGDFKLYDIRDNDFDLFIAVSHLIKIIKVYFKL